MFGGCTTVVAISSRLSKPENLARFDHVWGAQKRKSQSEKDDFYLLANESTPRHTRLSWCPSYARVQLQMILVDCPLTITIATDVNELVNEIFAMALPPVHLKVRLVLIAGRIQWP